MADHNLGHQVTGPVLLLAAAVKKALEEAGEDLTVKKTWGNFYVGKVELRWWDHGETAVVGYLVPDEGDGDTFDFWTPEDEQYESR